MSYDQLGLISVLSDVKVVTPAYFLIPSYWNTSFPFSHSKVVSAIGSEVCFCRQQQMDPVF